MDVAVVIVSWNVRDLLARCLRSVEASLAGADLRWQIVVVDSASVDGSAGMVRQEFPEVVVLELAENRGFAAANNAALRYLTLTPQPGEGVRYVLLLNADTEVGKSAIPEMVAYMDAHPGVGVLGPKLLYPDGTVQSSRRRFPAAGTLFWESTPLELAFPANPWARRYRLHGHPDDVQQEVDWLVGACLTVRGEAIRQAGLLDEGFFLYFEELEWCRRIRQAGWRVVYLPAAEVVHHEGRSTGQVPLQRHLYFQRSKVRYARMAFGPHWAGLLRWSLLLMDGCQFLLEGCKFLLGHKRELRRERMRAFCAVVRDGLGER